MHIYSKGVLADYKAHVKMEEARRDVKDQHREAVMRRMAGGYIIPSDADSSNLGENIFNITKNTNMDDELDELDDMDDDFLLEYRAKRLQGSNPYLYPSYISISIYTYTYI